MDSENPPRCVNLFNVMGDNWMFLPYDPDEMLNELVDEQEDDKSSVISVEAAVDLIDERVGVEHPDHVTQLAVDGLEDEYTYSDLEVVLHVMDAHAEVMWTKAQLVDEVPERASVGDSYASESNVIKQTFIMVRKQSSYAKETAYRFGKQIKKSLYRSKTTNDYQTEAKAEK